MNSRTICGVVALVMAAAPLGIAWAQEAVQNPDKATVQANAAEAPASDAPASAGHLEVPDDAYVPAVPGPRRTTPARLRIRNGHVSVQVNVDAGGDNIVGDAANEPSIAVDPTDHNRMAIGWRQFDTITSNFRQAGWGYTANGGQTWTFPGVIEPTVFRSDPVLDANADGVFFYNSLTTDDVDYWCHVFKSTTGGVSWDTGTYAYGGDKQWQVIDTTDGIGRNNIYACWNYFYSTCSPHHFTRSYDGGQTFRPCTTVPGQPYWGTLAVGPDGELYVSGDGITVAKSSTMRDETLPAAWDFSTTVSLGGSLSSSAGPNPGGLLGQVSIAVDHSAGPSRGNVYVLSSVSPFATSDPLDVMFSRSTNGGVSWSAPVRVNDDPLDNGAWQWFGTMSVAPNGRIDVVWNDSRNDPGGYDSELYYSYSDDAGQTWSPNEALSPSFNPHVGWPQQNKMGDYYDMVSDNTGADLAYAATFNGEQDVYYLRITRLLAISFPGELPEVLAPGEATEIAVRIVEGEDTYLSGSATLHYRYDGGVFVAIPLEPLGGELYRATLPPARCGDEPEYYFSAEGSVGGVTYQPAGAPATTFSARVGQFVTLAADNFETDQGWTAEVLGATSGDWQRGVPVNDPGWDYDPMSDSDGSGRCYLTQNELGNTDVDDGAVRLTSPTIDMSAGDITIRYDYFLRLTDDDGGDRLLVEINNGAPGAPWIEIARHDSDGGLSWRSHAIEQVDLDAAGVALTPSMTLRFTTNDADDQSINESGLDAFAVSAFQCSMPGQGDLDGDGDVDLDDYRIFAQDCFTGSEGAVEPGCEAADFDGDEDVDFADFAVFQVLFEGP